jgi:hypothetical protein
MDRMAQRLGEREAAGMDVDLHGGSSFDAVAGGSYGRPETE